MDLIYTNYNMAHLKFIYMLEQLVFIFEGLKVPAKRTSSSSSLVIFCSSGVSNSGNLKQPLDHGKFLRKENASREKWEAQPLNRSGSMVLALRFIHWLARLLFKSKHPQARLVTVPKCDKCLEY